MAAEARDGGRVSSWNSGLGDRLASTNVCSVVCIVVGHTTITLTLSPGKATIMLIMHIRLCVTARCFASSRLQAFQRRSSSNSSRMTDP